MSVLDSVDVSIEVFGGLVNNLAASDLPHGVSPDCQDLAFQIGSVRTRPGITSLYTLPGNPTVNYMQTWENLQEIPRFMSLDSLGNLRKDSTPGGALTTISSEIIPGSYCKSDALFGRNYLAFGGGLDGLDIPRQYDDTNLDRISQVGPGAAPTAQDASATDAVVASPNGLFNLTLPHNNCTIATINYSAVVNQISLTLSTGDIAAIVDGDSVIISGVINSAFDGTYSVLYGPADGGPPGELFLTANLGASSFSSTGGTLNTQVVKVVLAAGGNPVVGTNVTIASATDAAYDGSWDVRIVDSPSQFWVYIGTIAAEGNSGGGTVVSSGNIDAGVHQISVIFVTRSGYYTRPAPPNSWTAAGGNRVLCTNIPIGPPNIVARVLCFSGTNLDSFYHLGPTGLTIPSNQMYIADNTTTIATVDFSDQILLLGTLDDPLFTQIELPPVSGVIGYSNRLLAWGGQANEQSFLNLTFDGGFSNLASATTATGAGPNYPLGWLEDAIYGAGGGSANVTDHNVIFGDAYTIEGDGATAIRGKITQSAAIDYLLNPILLPNTAYGVRARILQLGATAGTVHINLQSTIGGYTTLGLAFQHNSITGTYQVFSNPLTAALGVIPSDLMLQVYVDGTPNNGAVFVIDNIEIYPLNQQFDNSTVLASFGQLDTQGQESFDSQTGQFDYNLNDGQSVRTMFKLRERLYVVKEHSFGVTEDNGQEPSFWTINDVSKAVGTPSVNGVGMGEDWAVIVHRTGLYLYWGGEVLKISEEIQPTWDTINWAYGYTISCTVDTRKRRILICAPFGASVTPNKTLVLDYHDVGSDAASIAANPPIHLTYTGNKKAFDRSRKWCPWTIAANSIAQIELSTGETGMYFGSNDGTGNINVLDDTNAVFTDNGATIPSYYTTAAFAELPTEDAKQLRSHRHLYTYFTMYVQGVGQIGITVFLASLSNGFVLNPQILANPSFRDSEMMLNQMTERMFMKFSSQGNGQWFDLQRGCINMRPDPNAIVRGAP